MACSAQHGINKHGTGAVTLDRARRYAEKILAELAPYCERAEIAGSIRRERPAPNDIDLVVLPSPGHAPAIRRRCLRSCPDVRQDGECQLLFVLDGGVQIDLWFASAREPDLFQPNPCTFGTRLLLRTGSAAFNAWFAVEAQRRGFHWNPYHGLYAHGRPIMAESEAELFSAIGLPYIPPRDRER